MKRIFLVFLAVWISVNTIVAQEATIHETKLQMKSYLFSDPDPVPEISRIYPYFRYDGYTNKGVEKEWNMVVLENDYIKVFVCPDIGGKIWGAVEKSTGREFMYFNHVVKFRDVAMRGAWTSGGLEYNFGDIGHDPNGATPVNYITRQNEDGSVSCIVGAADLVSRTKWNVEITVFKDKAFFETKASWFNNTSLPCTYYHWMNAAAKAAGNLQFLYPGNKKIGHGGEYGEWPVENGRDISYYEKNNFGVYKSYHVMNSYSDYFGGYWHDDDFGFGHHARFDETPGKKIWIWGLSQQGMIWEDLLTDNDGQYIEYQSGKLFNQAAFSSTFTPFKHREFIPHDADVIREIWFPLKNTGGMVAASDWAVLNIKKDDDRVGIYLSALQDIDDELKIYKGEKAIISNVKLRPLELFSTTFDIKPGEEFKVELGNKKLAYSSAKKDIIVDRPVEPNPGFDWNTSYGIYTRGLESEKQRMYPEALRLYLRCLGKEPAFVPALDRAALGYFRNMNYDSALYYVNRSLEVDTYDPLANYLYGLINYRKEDMAKAKNGFSIASQSVEYRSAAFTELAVAYLYENNLTVAGEYSKKAMDYNSNNITALEILALKYRKENNKEKAQEALIALEGLDPTSTLAAFEKVRWNMTGYEEFDKNIRNELKHETYLELALKYRRYGFIEDAIGILKRAPEQPIVLLWLAYLDKSNQGSFLQKAIDSSIEMVFPHRNETADMLRYFIGKNDNWKLKYYLALIYWNKGLTSEAKELMAACGDSPDNFIFYLANARLSGNDKDKKLNSLEKARELNNSDWRVNIEWIDHYMQNGDYGNAGKLSEIFLKKYPEKSEFGFRYAKALLGQKEYSKGIKFFEKFVVIPNEGATAGRNIYHETCIRAAYDAIKKGKYKDAITFGQKAKQWLPNLGVGRPYDVDERLDDFIIALSCEKAGNMKMAEEYYSKVKEYTIPDFMEENSKLILQSILLRKEGRDEKARNMISSAVKKYPGNEYVGWVQAYYTGSGNAEQLKNDILNNPVRARSYDIRFIDQEFRLVTDLLGIIQ